MTTGSADRGERDAPSTDRGPTADPGPTTPSVLWVGGGDTPAPGLSDPGLSGPGTLAGDLSAQAGGSFPSPQGEPAALLKAASGPADNLDTGALASAEPASSGVAEVQDPVFASGVPEPVFYVPPTEEETLPASSVVELGPDALDAALHAEFGSTTSEPAAPMWSTPPPPPVMSAPPQSSAATFVTGSTVAPPPTADVSASPSPVQTSVIEDTTDRSAESRSRGRTGGGRWWKRSSSTLVSGRKGRALNANVDADRVLDILLGVRPHSANGSAPTHATLGPDAVVAPPVAPAPIEALLSPAPPPPPAPTRAPAASEPAFVTPSPVDVVPAPPLSTAPPPPPVPAPPPPLPARPAMAVPAPPVVAPPPPPGSMAPATPLEPEVAPAPPPSWDEPLFTRDSSGVFRLDEELTTSDATPVTFDEPVDPIAAAATHTDEAPTADAVPETETHDEWTAPIESAEPLYASAASMATEILSTAPDTPIVAEPETSPEDELISKDLTLIARGRRRRFRLR